MSPAQISSTFDTTTGIARIVFNRPDVLNAIDLEMAVAFRDAVLRTVCEPGLRCIVLSGNGRAFVAGGDVASFRHEPAKIADELLMALHPAILALRSCSAPVLAVIAGPAAGAGLSLVLGADFALASDRATFLVAYNRIGAPPDCGGTWFLPRKVGRTRSFAMMLLDESLDAAAALDAGIVSEVVPAEDLDRRAAEIAARLASGPTQAYGQFKRLIDSALATSLDHQLENERMAFLATTRTEDFGEGVDAFLGKRAPSFTGR